jgi:hypothetical protein
MIFSVQSAIHGERRLQGAVAIRAEVPALFAVQLLSVAREKPSVSWVPTANQWQQRFGRIFGAFGVLFG